MTPEDSPVSLQTLASPIVRRAGCVLLVTARAGYDAQGRLVGEVMAVAYDTEIDAEIALQAVKRHGMAALPGTPPIAPTSANRNGEQS